jgi:dTDP-4-dehydrorhamnose reductase
VNGSDIVVSIAQVAAGGTIVQALVALFRRRSELRQLDRSTDGVEVETAKSVVTMVREDLVQNRAEMAQMKKDHAAREADMQRQIIQLSEELSRVRAELAIAKAEIGRLQGGTL